MGLSHRDWVCRAGIFYDLFVSGSGEAVKARAFGSSAHPAELQEHKPPHIFMVPSGPAGCPWLRLPALRGSEGRAFCFVLARACESCDQTQDPEA